MESEKMKTGKEYSFAGYRWIPIEIDENKQIAVMQSLGVTSGPWPGFSMEKFGDDNYYDRHIAGADISSYNEATEKLMEQIKSVVIDTLSGRGLYLASYKNIDSVEDVHTNNVWKTALAKAAANFSLFGAPVNDVWLGTVYGSSNAWYVYQYGGMYNNYYQDSTFVVAPAFNLDLTKIEIKGDEIAIKNI